MIAGWQMPPDTLPFGVIPLPVLLLNREGFITQANDQAMLKLDLSERRLVGTHLSSIFKPDEAVQHLLDCAVIRGEEVTSHDLVRRTNDVPFGLHAGPTEHGAAMILVPEANRQSVDQHAHHREMAETVARIALEMAHEVKNPLAALSGATQWLSEQTLPEGSREATEMMMSEIERIRERIDSFLLLGPRAPIDMQSVNIHSIIEDVCAAPSDIEIRRLYDPSLPDIRGNPARLRHVFENLWRNAMESGASKIEWKTCVAMNANLPGHQGAVIEASICDNGSGIPASVRDHLFEPFVTGKERGSGLGLAIAQRVMLNHGGRIVLNTQSDRTCFVLQFPLAQS
jgi:two-component system nitrogen regulation sensor histidine kinase GlnL